MTDGRFRSRGQSGEQYVVTADGRESEPTDRRPAMRNAGNLARTASLVEVRRLRPGKKSVLVAIWENGVKTK